MSAIIKWKKPAASLDREPEHLRPEMARLQKLWLKWWTFGSIFCLGVVYYLEPDLLLFIACVLAVFYILPLVHPRLMACPRRSIITTRYQVTTKGLLQYDDHAIRHHRWKDIEWFRITDAPESHSIRLLQFKLRPYGDMRYWAFDPSRTDEQNLRQVLNEYLPGRSWENVGKI